MWGRPHGSGYAVAKELAEVDIPVQIILDSAVGYTMEKVCTFVSAILPLMRRNDAGNEVEGNDLHRTTFIILRL
jgi:hypothetical protein